MITRYRTFASSTTGLNGYIGITYADSTTGDHGWNTTYSNGSGDDWSNDAAYVGRWQKVSLIAALNDKSPSSINAMYIYADRLTQGEGVFTNFIITEHATFPTGPVRYTAGTRSVTQGLKDLTGRSTINLSNVSFDSNAQPSWDGTDDYIELSAASWNILTTHTLEAVFKANGTPGSGYHPLFQKEGGYSGGAVYGLRATPSSQIYAMICYDDQVASQNTLGSTTVLENGKWYHITATFDSGYKWKLYINGIQENTATLTNNPYQNTSAITIGQGDSRKMNGNLPVMKIYNRALSASEIQQNFNAVRGRYGI